MKLQVKILAVLLLVAGISTASMATDPKKTDVAVKILPSGKSGLLKLLYVNPGQKNVEIKFYGTKGLLFAENVKSNRFKDGFIKFYDIKELKPGTYWLEVIDTEQSVKYEIALTKNTMWVNYWDNYLPADQAVAMKK